jgi:hypothetical protein
MEGPIAHGRGQGSVNELRATWTVEFVPITVGSNLRIADHTGATRKVNADSITTVLLDL